MEIGAVLHHIKKRGCTCCLIFFWMTVGTFNIYAQSNTKKYTIKDGKMMIELSKRLKEAALDSFIIKFDLFDLNLKQFIKTNSTDSLQKLGWKLEKNDPEFFVISKPLRGFDKFNNPADKIIFTEKASSAGIRFPTMNKAVKYGYNIFKKKDPFTVRDSLVIFFLRNNTAAQKAMLAGSFKNWDPLTLPMRKTDSGWVATVKLGPGKYWYKFIIDGNWTVDKDNARVENDGEGNDNSVYYKPNIVFRLKGFDNAKKVFVAGSFNQWEPRELMMIKTEGLWQLPLYLAYGTHTYRFVVDGKWMTDPENSDRLPNEFNEFNSVLRTGIPYMFKLTGHTAAKRVTLAGSFNDWKQYELLMDKTPEGWQLPYTLGPGNYEYQFNVDGKSVTDQANPSHNTDQRKAYLIVSPNYTFRLNGFNTAKNVFIAGDFNDWSPNTFPMKRDGDKWVMSVYLSPGKHLYKFVVDGNWIIDPGNKLWEQNEFATGNSVVWFEK